MISIAQTFQQLKAKGEKAFIAHVYYGDPTPEFSMRLIQTVLDNGVDILEFGIPFSDPVCDGPTFQQACMRSLQHGTTPDDCLEGLAKVRRLGYTQPIIVTTYYNSIFVMGEETFVKRAATVGAQAIICPDILFEEQTGLISLGDKYGIDIIQFATPNSTQERLKLILQKAKGFVYVIAASGTTGVRLKVNTDIPKTVGMIQHVSHLPTLVGFGISNPEQAMYYMNNGADGVTVGSAIGKLYESHLNRPDGSLKQIVAFTRALKESTIGKEIL